MRKLVLGLTFIILFVGGCSDNSNKKEEAGIQSKTNQAVVKQKEANTPVADSSEKKSEQGVVQKSSETVKKASEVIKKSADEVIEKTKELAKQAGDNKMVQDYAKKVTEGTKKIVAMATTPSDKSSQKASEPNGNGKELFMACAGCHGNKAQNKALGVSKVIAGWDAGKIENALKGYKNGTYGGAMKGVMSAQAAHLSDEDIKAVAKYISSLK